MISTLTSASLFVIGDSISIQYGPYLEKLVANTFLYDRKQDDAGAPRAASNLDVPTGANGGDAGMVLAYLHHRRFHNPIPPGFLLVNCGLHDIKTHTATGNKQVPLARYKENLRAILNEARFMKLRFIWIRTTPIIDEHHNSRCNDFHRFACDVMAYNAAADAIMAGSGIDIIDLHTFTEKFLPAGFIDHVHFTEDVREKQAAFIFEKLSSLVATM